MKPYHWLLLVLLSLIWGMSFLFMKVGVQDFPPVWVAGLRISFGAAFLLSFLRVTGRSLPPRRFWGALLVAGFFSNAFPWILLPWAEIRITSGLASILNATTPLFTIVIASIWDDEVFTVIRGVGVIVGFAGVSLLIDVDVRDLLADNLLAELAVLGASASYAVGAVWVRRTLRGPSSHQLAAGQLVAGAVLLSPVVLGTGAPAQMPSMPALGAVVALGVLGSGLAYLLYFRLLTEVGATRTMLVTYLVPVTALFWGWLVLDETFGLQTLAGMGAILFGVLLVNSRRGQPAIISTVRGDA